MGGKGTDQQGEHGHRAEQEQRIAVEGVEQFAHPAAPAAGNQARISVG